MAGNRSAVLRLLASVADGESPDWTGVESEPLSTTARDLNVLRAIASLADVHRTLIDADVVDAEASWTGPGRIVGRIGPAGQRSDALPPREQWGAFILVDRLGSGTSADVFRAYEPRLDRHVALKLFKPGASSSEDRRAAMLQEARALARVHHPNVVCIHGADEIDDVVGIWMELVVGRSLEAELRERGPWTAPEAAAAGVEICQALSAVHAAGFVHGDIKATNVVREDSGRLVLMDFGARQVLHAGPRERLTGTPLYLAPEVPDDGGDQRRERRLQPGRVAPSLGDRRLSCRRFLARVVAQAASSARDATGRQPGGWSRSRSAAGARSRARTESGGPVPFSCRDGRGAQALAPRQE